MYNHVQCSLVIVSLEGIIFSEITNLILIKSVYFRVRIVFYIPRKYNAHHLGHTFFFVRNSIV